MVLVEEVSIEDGEEVWKGLGVHDGGFLGAVQLVYGKL